MKLLAAALLMCVVPIGVLERQSRDFSGTWIAVADAPAGAVPAAGPLLGAKLGIRQQGNTVTFRRVPREQVVDSTFRVDGPETQVRVPGRLCEGDAATLERLAWDDNTLTHHMLGAIDPGTTVVRKIEDMTHQLRLEGPDTLVVRRPFAARGTPPARTVGSGYRRSPESLPEPDQPAVKGLAASIAQVGWISGDWFGAAQTGVTFEERWTPAASGSIIALGRTLDARGFLIRFELLCIAEQQGTLAYFAMPQGRMPATKFTLTTLTGESATFENPANSYPKVIRYVIRPDGSLETTISGANNERAQTFLLKHRR